jgi:ATP-dependent helicase/nuclease subunit A
MSQRPDSRPARSPQVSASDPAASVFVAANAGSGKTKTLVDRVARLLLSGSRPEAILCVTYTKAAAAEMQRRLFKELGDWAVMEDAPLAAKLAGLEEPRRDLGLARALFARALETPGGIKITTIHAFCEKLLRRFPLEAAVSPGFTVLEDAAAREVSAKAREDVAMLALADPSGRVGKAYAYFSAASTTCSPPSRRSGGRSRPMSRPASRWATSTTSGAAAASAMKPMPTPSRPRRWRRSAGASGGARPRRC